MISIGWSRHEEHKAVTLRLTLNSEGLRELADYLAGSGHYLEAQRAWDAAVKLEKEETS